MKDRLILHNILIEGVAAEGKAIAHAKLPTESEDATARVMFVEYAVPGDVVDVLVTKRKKNYLEGRVERIVSPSEHRLTPFCEHFGVCGGCKWQHLPYEMQLEAKTRQVYDQLVRIGHLNVPEINPTLPSEHTIEYRNKLEFSASDHRWIFPDEDSMWAGSSIRCWTSSTAIFRRSRLMLSVSSLRSTPWSIKSRSITSGRTPECFVICSFALPRTDR